MSFSLLTSFYQQKQLRERGGSKVLMHSRKEESRAGKECFGTGILLFAGDGSKLFYPKNSQRTEKDSTPWTITTVLSPISIS